MLKLILTVFMLLVALPAWSATFYAGLGGSDSNSCTLAQTIGTHKLTFASVKTCIVAGSTVKLLSGSTFTEALNLVGVTGSSTLPITIMANSGPGTVTFVAQNTGSPPSACRTLITGGGVVNNWVTLQDLVFNGTGCNDLLVGNRLDGVTNFTMRGIEIYGFKSVGLLLSFNPTNVVIENSYFHDQVSPNCASGHRYYGIYAHDTTNLTIRNSVFSGNPGGGLQIYPGPHVGVTISNNRIFNNSNCPAEGSVGGLIVAADSTGGNISGVVVSRNIIYSNGDGSTGGGGGGIRTYASGGKTQIGTQIINNTIYNNQTFTGPAYGINVGNGTTGVSGTVVKNNIVLANESGQIVDSGTGTVTATNKTTGTITDCTVSTTDFTLKAGSSCLNAGTVVSGFSYNGTLPDIGAFETFGFTGGSATINDATIDVTLGMAFNTPVLNLVAAQWTVGCTGSNCGTPVVANATLKSGTDSVVRLTLSGLGGSGVCEIGQTWTVTATATGATDSSLIGNATNQPITAIAAGAVMNACTGGGTTPPAAGLHVHYLLDDNTGTIANDATANNLDGTLTNGPTWVTGHTGSAVSFADSTTESYLAVPYGTGLNPSSSSISVCLGVLPHSTSQQQKIVFSADNGTNQRFYIGWIGGTWGLGIQASGFSSGSEFPLVANWTRLCLVANSGTDTATLYVNGVKGTVSEKSVKTYTSYTLASNFKVGVGTFDINYGGSTADDVKIYAATALTDQEVADDYLAWEPVTPVAGTFTQKTHQFYEARYLPGTTTTVALGSAGGGISVAIGQAFALVTQTDCTGANCDPIAQRLHYSRNGGAFLPVPDDCIGDFICFFGETSDIDVLNGAVTCCLTGALTPLDGTTQRTANAIPVYDLPQNGSTVHRRVLKVDANAVLTDTYDFKEYNQTGSAFTTYDPAGGARITIASGISAPTNLHLAGAASSVSVALVWSAVTSSNTSGYHIYASTTSGVQGTLVATVTTASSVLTHMPPTTWYAHTLPSGTQYVVVRAFDFDGNESAATSETTVVVPAAIARTARTP